MVRRGQCSFQQKATNYQKYAEAMIVLNSDPSELFVMSGDPASPAAELPITVLISGNDGEHLLSIMREEESNGHEIYGSVHLVKQNNNIQSPPFVQGNKESLQILAKNKWGVTAIQQEQKDQTVGWQLFITQHDGLKSG